MDPVRPRASRLFFAVGVLSKVLDVTVVAQLERAGSGTTRLVRAPNSVVSPAFSRTSTDRRHGVLIVPGLDDGEAEVPVGVLGIATPPDQGSAPSRVRLLDTMP